MIRAPVGISVRVRIVCRSMANHRLRRSGRLRFGFRTDAAAWPHRAADLTRRRVNRRATKTPLLSALTAALIRPVCAPQGAVGARRARSEAGIGEPMPRGEFGPCDP
jgi:hypothetical protein